MRNLPAATLSVPTRSRCEMVDITRRIMQRIQQQPVRSGMVVVCVPHTTAGITINENADPDVRHDLLRKLDALIPQREAFYQHSEGNSDSHLKTSLVGNSVTLLIENGDLVLGRWQGVYLCEFDGPRERQVIVKVVNFDGADNA